MNSSLDLLSRLQGGQGRASQSAPTRALGRSPLTQGSVGGAGFAELLSQATEGQTKSGLPVQVAPGSGLELSDEQLGRLATMADRAEAAGASRVLVKLDDQWVKLDVGTRQVTGAAELKPGEVLSGIDGVVKAPERAGAENAGLVGVPRAPLSMNSSLIDALSQPGSTQRM